MLRNLAHEVYPEVFGLPNFGRTGFAGQPSGEERKKVYLEALVGTAARKLFVVREEMARRHTFSDDSEQIFSASKRYCFSPSSL